MPPGSRLHLFVSSLSEEHAARSRAHPPLPDQAVTYYYLRDGGRLRGAGS
jgi:hypothetical protein